MRSAAIFTEDRFDSLMTALPAAFMSAVSLTYILIANEGFGLSAGMAYPAGILFAAALCKVPHDQPQRS